MSIIEKYNKDTISRLMVGKTIPNFRAGDTLVVNVMISEGNSKRVQAFEGVCIARRNSSVGSTFTVRKVSNGEGIEKTFNLYSPAIQSITVARYGMVRRAKLYYLRDRRGKAARIKEKKVYHKKS